MTYSIRKALSYGYKIAKIGKVYRRYSAKYASYWPCRKKSSQMSPVFSGVTGPSLRNFFHYIEASIICSVNVHIDAAIFYFVLE